jgi:hypothetical protein
MGWVCASADRCLDNLSVWAHFVGPKLHASQSHSLPPLPYPSSLPPYLSSPPKWTPHRPPTVSAVEAGWANDEVVSRTAARCEGLPKWQELYESWSNNGGLQSNVIDLEGGIASATTQSLWPRGRNTSKADAQREVASQVVVETSKLFLPIRRC